MGPVTGSHAPLDLLRCWVAYLISTGRRYMRTVAAPIVGQNNFFNVQV